MSRSVAVAAAVMVVGLLTTAMVLGYGFGGEEEVAVSRLQAMKEELDALKGQVAASSGSLKAEVPSRLQHVLGKTHTARLAANDELLQAAADPPGPTESFMSAFKSPDTAALGKPTLPEKTLQADLSEKGFGMIPGMLSRPAAATLRKYILSLLNQEGVVWKPNEGDNPGNGTLGRACYGLPPKFYPPLETVMADPNMVRYMSSLMPGICPGVEEKTYRITQIFMTVNDRIRWHVDFPNQGPFDARGKTTMYSKDFCQIKTIFYLQDHGEEGPGNPSALMVVPDTHLHEPHWTRCKPKGNCSIARKGIVPSSEYTSVNLKPNLGDLLVMDARLLHAAADSSLSLPTPPQPTQRLHKYRVFLQFLFGITSNKLTDVMQKKKDKNLVTAHFKKKVFP